MKTITKTINIGTEFLLSGVEDYLSDLLEDGYTMASALDIIVEDAVLRYEINKSYPGYIEVGTSSEGYGVFEVELEKIK
jgi:hypothetical protein